MKQQVPTPGPLTPRRAVEQQPPRVEGGPPRRSLLDVPVHAPITHDARAESIASATKSRAITVGSRIYIAPAHYAPETTHGRELIAHEQVHVEQQKLGIVRSAGSIATAEAEARELAPVIARAGWDGVRVRHPAGLAMRDKIPDEDLSDDRDAIKDKLEANYPWLAMLSNRKEIEYQFAEYIATEKEIIVTNTAIAALPDPRATYESVKIEQREHARAPYYRRLDKQAAEHRKHPHWIKINPMEIVSKQFWADAKVSTGEAAMLEMLAQSTVMVGTYRMGSDAFRYGIDVRLGGAWLPVESDGIHGTGFFRGGQAFLDFQLAFYNATAAQLTGMMNQLTDLDPSIAERELDKYIAEQDAAALGAAPRPLTAEEQEVEAYKTANKQYAETLRQKTEKAVAPLVMIASFFEIDGPVDLLLRVVPVEKIAAKLFTAGREALAARRVRKLEQALIRTFESNLDSEASVFLKLATRMSKNELKALTTIHEALSVKSQALIETLMRRSLEGNANLVWIAEKVKKGHINGDFVRAFTQAESGLSWTLFEDIVEGEAKGVSEKARASMANKIKGLMGEEAAYKVMRGEKFVQQTLGNRIGAKLTKIWREIPYGSTKSLDIFAESDKGELIAAEVKHYNTDSWLSNQKQVLDQLERHNQGIDDIARAIGRRTTDVKKKILFASQNGFSALDGATQRALTVSFRQRGWTLQLIPDASIEKFDELIDRVR